MKESDVSNIIHTGGTILRTARSERFRTEIGLEKAIENLKKFNIEGLVIIGGDGSYKGAAALAERHPIQVIGIPGTIDKDLSGTDTTLGFDTAVNTAMYAIDKIRDTAEAHDRIFFVEVMGRDAGYIALNAGLCTGSEAILIPETKTYIDHLVELLENGWKRKKKSHIIIVAEGDDAGGAIEVSNAVKQKFNYIESRVTILGHLQRGGSPSMADRLLGTRWGFAAVEKLVEGKSGIALGVVNGEINETLLTIVNKEHPGLSEEMMRMLYILAN
jgi:6-phosphofructokinase 1